MNKQEIVHAIQNLDFKRPKDFEALAKEISSRSREEVDLVVELWIENYQNLGDKAAALLVDLHDVAIESLIDAGAPPLAMQRTQGIAIMVNGQIYWRERTVTYLVKLLDDKEVLPDVATSKQIEGERPVRRVCDEAYLQLRRLLNTTESEDAYLQNASIYLHLDFDERDEEIATVLASGKWDRWFDESAEEE